MKNNWENRRKFYEKPENSEIIQGKSRKVLGKTKKFRINPGKFSLKLSFEKFI